MLGYLQHGFLDAIGVDEAIARKVGDQCLVTVAGAAPGHAVCSGPLQRGWEERAAYGAADIG